ncbi:MAG: hypothetical protein ACREQV_24710, partial [Candidatus Binatia bacterium]
MERTIKPPLVWLLKREVNNSIRVLARAKWHAFIVKTYCIGSHVSEKPFTELPDLFRHGQCETIKAERKIRVLRMPLPIEQTIKSVYVKQHNTLLPHRLASFF